MSNEVETLYEERVPLWLAVAVTGFFAMPLSLWLGEDNFTLWCAFIVWAQYFALGAKVEALKIIYPSFIYAAVLTSLLLMLLPLLGGLPSLVSEGDLAVTLLLSAGFGVAVYSMKWSETLQQGSLPFFNGITMTLAIYFTKSYPVLVQSFPLEISAGIWTILMGLFGGLLGVFNIYLTFPKAVSR